MSLPVSNSVDTYKLQKLFDNMSECYKLFWFKGIVDLVFEGKNELTYNQVIDKMIAETWYMVCEYKLNLGPNDTLEKLIIEASSLTKLKSSEKEAEILKALYSLDGKSINTMKRKLTENVPYRLLAPFLKTEQEKNWSLPHKQQALFINQNPAIIYEFVTIDGLNSKIRVRDNWANYIKDNYDIIKGWIDYNTIKYLQKRNPSVPAISDKLTAPGKRDLSKPTLYWKAVIESTDLHDIYIGNSLRVNELSIDHFIPWSYVCHDELWNLVPTTKRVNSSKSNNLPDLNTYLEKLSEMEYQAFDLTRTNYKVKAAFIKCADKHINDESIRRTLYREEIDKIEFSNRLKEIIEPIYNSAIRLGFDIWKG